MIEVNLLTKNNIPCGFEITGHADFDQHGKDIVCAAVSILAYTSVNTLDLYDIKADFSDDDTTMSLVTKSDNNDARVILTTFKTGIWTLTQSYSDFVKLYTKEIWNDFKH